MKVKLNAIKFGLNKCCVGVVWCVLWGNTVFTLKQCRFKLVFKDVWGLLIWVVQQKIRNLEKDTITEPHFDMVCNSELTFVVFGFALNIDYATWSLVCFWKADNSKQRQNIKGLWWRAQNKCLMNMIINMHIKVEPIHLFGNGDLSGNKQGKYI